MTIDNALKEIEERKQHEIEHSDRRRSIVRAYEYHTDASEEQSINKIVDSKTEYLVHFSNMKFYSITQVSFAYRDALLLEGIEGSVALDYCCGNGEIAIEMAKRGAKRVLGIDISSVAIDNARALAKAAGVEAVCEFQVMDAEETLFDSGTFDVIHEYGALHHLDLQAAYAELSRILKPGGKLVCTEALRHNPLVHWYRKCTPHLRTQWEVEHILGIPEIESGRKYFGYLSLRTFHLVALAAVPLRKTSFFGPMLRMMNLVDRILLSIPFLRRMAWIAVVEYKKPTRRDC